MKPLFCYLALIGAAGMWVWGFCRGYDVGEGDMRAKHLRDSANSEARCTKNPVAPQLDE